MTAEPLRPDLRLFSSGSLRGRGQEQTEIAAPPDPRGVYFTKFGPRQLLNEKGSLPSHFLRG